MQVYSIHIISLYTKILRKFQPLRLKLATKCSKLSLTDSPVPHFPPIPLGTHLRVVCMVQTANTFAAGSTLDVSLQMK